MINYNTLIFDLDGTLLDTLGDLTDGVNYVLSRFSFENRTSNEVRSFVGNGISALIRRALPEGSSDELHAEAICLFNEYYKNNMKNKTLPYEGIYNLLKKLKENGCKIGVVSNKNDSAVKELCTFFFEDIFNGDKVKYAFGTTTEDTRKPSPRLVYDALKMLDSEKNKTVFIGDSDVDFQTAKNAGVDIICVGWGYRSAEYLRTAGAKSIVNDVNELWILLTALA